MVMRQVGIYKIANLLNGKIYIGSSRNCEQRKELHFNALKKRKHHNPHLQSAWEKYGKSAFEFSIIERCEDGELLAREQHWLDALSPQYNILTKAGSPIGRKVSSETRIKMSRAFKGREVSEATRRKLSDALRGRKRDPEIVQRIAEKRRGRKGKSPTEETRKKIAAALVGRKNGPLPESARQKIALKALGRHHSIEVRAKISANRSGLGCGKRPESVGFSIAKAKAVLSPEQIIEIRLLCDGGIKHLDVATQFGISKTTAGQIARRQTYRWV